MHYCVLHNRIAHSCNSKVFENLKRQDPIGFKKYVDRIRTFKERYTKTPGVNDKSDSASSNIGKSSDDDVDGVAKKDNDVLGVGGKNICSHTTREKGEMERGRKEMEK